MDIKVGDKLKMKKKHPCGADTMDVLRAGVDFRLRCTGCGHDFFVARSKIEKNIKSVIREDSTHV
ncbi:MAG: DUF951 domain-containing protein [Oscillospiraceae bacterium]|jgi:hypothetical protein|nr:DUF951 domain-containing protein [Oscillospiraceae bacterium]MBR4346686.1 DUF951 domain-containing protein [Oscillospiraceae bacterium]